MATDTKLRVSRRERKLHLSYELPHRVHTSAIYPVAAPNGSTVIIYGYGCGLRVLWRGGKRRTAPGTSQSQSEGTQSQEVVMLENEDELAAQQRKEDDKDEFEAEEEELDTDCPHSGIVQSLDLPTGSDVLQIAIPPLSSASIVPKLLRKVAIVIMSSADGALRLLQIPLMPPTDNGKEAAVKEIVRSQVELASNGPITTALSTKFLPLDSPQFFTQKKQKENVEGQLLVAASTRALNIWSVSMTAEALLVEDKTLIRRVPLHAPVVSLGFHPSPRSTQLLLADGDGFARLYDPHAFQMLQRRPGSSDSTVQAPTSTAEAGKWVMAFHTPFNAAKERQAAPALARRKKILGASWILSGKGVLAVLEDGQWGIWTTSLSMTLERRIEDFAFDGYLDAASSNELTESTMTKKGSSKLAPMTPNTRKTRTEQLFSDTPRVTGAAPRGGISVVSASAKTGQVDESIALWYNSEIYSISSMQAFWQRSTTNSGAVGSLYAPGLSHVTDLDLSNENITSVSQFSANSSTGRMGQMNTQRDMLISAENRMIVLQSLRPQTSSRNLFQVADRPTSREQQTGALSDIDRALEDMAAGTGAPRRVGFAAY